MLPHVHPENGHLTAAHDGILILGGDDAQPAAVLGSRLLDEPAPATTLDAQERSREGLFEAVKAAECLFNLGHQQRGRLRVVGLWCIGGGQVLPEERVVDVAAAVELDSGLLGDLGGDVVGGDGGDVGLQGVVEVGHIGLVVLAVVKLHDLGRDVGLQSLDRDAGVRHHHGVLVLPYSSSPCRIGRRTETISYDKASSMAYIVGIRQLWQRISREARHGGCVSCHGLKRSL